MLNGEQQAVVNHTWGPALVLAGPGSGKTRTVVHRTARLLGEGIPPEEITLVTFTRKAAGEMQERLAHLVGEEVARRVWVSTFHSLAAGILRDTGPIKVLDAEAAREKIGQFLEELGAPRKLTAKTVQGAISRAKNAGWSEEELASQYADLEPYVTGTFRLYEQYKRGEGYLDFDDLILYAAEALKDPTLRSRWSQRARFLIVDEYQDTNLQQFLLINRLLGHERNIMAVGDPNQAIYSWRGADFRLILEFKRHFPEAQVYRLSTSYRSHSGILDAAMGVIRNNRNREDLPLKALRQGELPLKVTAETREAEALFVAEAVKYHMDQGVPPEEIAVLMRSLAYSRLVEASLSRYNIPYTVVGGVGFWARKEVKLVLNLLRASYGDKAALTTVIAQTVPGFGPKKAQKAAEDLSFLKGQPLLDVLTTAQELHGYHGIGLVNAFSSWLAHWREDFFKPILLDWTEGVLEAATERWENMEEITSALRGFVNLTPRGTLDLFLQDLLLSQEDPTGEGQGVKLMTLHASKGLEFHTVFIVGLARGLFPTWGALRQMDSLEEERRLFYVGITRAKEHLYLTTYQVGERGYNEPSPFLGEVLGQVIYYNPHIGFHGRETTKAANSLSEIASLDW